MGFDFVRNHVLAVEFRTLIESDDVRNPFLITAREPYRTSLGVPAAVDRLELFVAPFK